MSIEKLTSTIIETAQKQAQEINNKYQAEIKKIEDSTQTEIQKLTQENEEFISRQKSLVQTRIISNAELTAKQQILQTKRQIIDNVFTKAKQRFLESENYGNFLKKIISQHCDDKTELFIAGRDKDRIQKLIPNLKYSISDSLFGGVIIRRGRIELNFSIDKIFESLKNDLIIDLSTLLFTK